MPLLTTRALRIAWWLALWAAPVLAQGRQPLPLVIDPRAHGAAQRLIGLSFFDSSYARTRRVWIYTPAGYDSAAVRPYPLLIAFDGAEYQDTMPLPLILDTLARRALAPAFVAVLIDDGGGAQRIADLGNAMRMVTFLERQLLPWVRRSWRVTSDPSRVVITGSSAGGLAAAFVALQRPGLFGNVLAQSGAFWRGREASNDAPYEWLTTFVSREPRVAVRFWMDVGAGEDHPTLGGRGPNFLEANRRLRDVLLAKGYDVVYTEVSGGQHAPQYWMLRLPEGIVGLTAGWR